MAKVYYQSGGITLWHGDCRDVLPKLPAGSIDCVISDPPYGARRPSAWRLADQQFDEVNGNESVDGSWLPLAFAVVKDSGAIYLFTCWDVLEQWRQLMGRSDFRVRSCIVWDKMNHGLADLETCWAPQHEMILFGAKGRHVLGGRRPKDVLRVPRVDSAKLRHPYQKPEGIIAPLITASSREGDTILDTHCGSGATLIAARDAGRKAIGIELEEKYCEIIARRLSQGILAFD